MDINYLIQLLGNRLNGLTLAKDQAFSSGDLERINAIDLEIMDVKNTISKLNLVATIEQTAAATPFTEAQVVQNGIEASFNPSIINDATKCLLEYDITPYATDPTHELKIQNILEKMSFMDSAERIDTYIKKTSPDTPLSGVMIWNAASQYSVDPRLMMALIELDSRFGTLGVAVRTFNPGNVGNNDAGETYTFPSWEDGTMAVAKWLDNHRIVKNAVVLPEPVQTPTPEPVVEPEPIPVPDPIPTPEPIPEPITPPVLDTLPEVNESGDSPTVSKIKRKSKMFS